MKTTKIIGSTTLAGTLLFTGFGATHFNEAHADSQDKETLTLATPEKWQKKHDEMLKGRLANPNHGGEGGGPTSINSYDKSYAEYVKHNLDYAKNSNWVDIKVPQEGKDYLNGNQTQANNNATQSSQATNQTVNNNSNNQGMAQNNEQPTQATDNTVNNNANNQAMTQDGQQQTQAMNNTAVANHNANEQQTNQMTQSDAKVLPETGETASNGTLVTLVASVLLAAGSLLTFKRFSKNNQ
ncbi:LPXTG-motif cell wall-anchored protein [Staphylococcus caledonicus]|uniref:LPXTG cell wall anchor domain-containing protein n=1 Tax=Staphylococcus caledonicus TaxID=2741333 RepID=UPI003C2E5875